MKKAYYYNRKFPEYPIREFNISDISYVVSKKEKWLYCLESTWNIEMDCEQDWIKPYRVYAPYEDKDILIYETNRETEYAISFNKKTIEEWHKEDCKYLKHKLQDRLDKLNNLGVMLS